MIPQAFVDVLDDLLTQAFACSTAAAASGLAARAWQVPSNYPLGVDIAAADGFGEALDRGDLNDACLEAYATGNQPNAGRNGQVMAAKRAIDYVAALERALLARHATGLRSRVWASARRYGHGDNEAGVFAAVLADITSLDAASVAVGNAPTPEEGGPEEDEEE